MGCSRDNYRMGGYGSLLYNHRGLSAMSAYRKMTLGYNRSLVEFFKI